MNESDKSIRISAGDVSTPWEADLRASAAEALKLAEQRVGLDLDEPPFVETIAPEQKFYDALGWRPHNIMAVAMAHENRIVINRSKFNTVGAAERRAVLVHEFTHLILGRRIPGGVPRWLNEGMAMLAEGEHAPGYHTRLVMAASFGGLIPLDQLWETASMSESSQELAYAQSLSATRYFLRWQTGSDKPGHRELGIVARKLADPEEGERLRMLLFRDDFLRAFDKGWRESISTIWAWVAALTGGSIVWSGATVLFFFAYWRKKRIARAREAEWSREEDLSWDGEYDLEWEEEEGWE